MVGFLRKKKSDKVMLSHETALDRKGKVDGASLLDGNGDPTSGSLYDMRHPGARRNSNQENAGYDHAAVANAHTYPPPYPQQQQQQHLQPFGASNNYPTSNSYPPSNNSSYPVPTAMHTGFGAPINNTNSYPRQYGYGAQPPPQQPQQPQQPQYPVRYGAHLQQQSFGNGPMQYGTPGYGAPQQPQYPVQYGHHPPPMQEAPKKSSFFRIPSMGKKN
ncbi:hypothetical protein PybrP1_003061 [[Pythium] brassicae (nom. inval.)]|nr:hypothetical protein PybrP1_003061 [[Pythium] brassicae (nom. inval.)]